MAVTDEQISAVDNFLTDDAKILDGYQPHWGYNSGYGDFQLSWPIRELSGDRVRAQVRFRLSEGDFRFPSVSLIFRGTPVCRLDLAPSHVCKPNPRSAVQYDLPALVCGNHCHEWETNRSHVWQSGRWELPIRTDIADEMTGLDQMLRWFCEKICVTIQSHNTPMVGPEAGLFTVPNA